MIAIQERNVFRLSGWAVLGVDLLMLATIVMLIVSVARGPSNGEFPLGLIPVFVLLIGWVLLKPGYFLIHPNEAKVFVFLGKYVGSERAPGFHWTNPFAVRRKVSLRMNNFNSPAIKVNDLLGNPIEIAAVVVWRVSDSAKATFDVENYVDFVSIQSETAIRALASHFPYDVHEPGKKSLRGDPDDIAQALNAQVQERLMLAGIEVHEARISHLAYAPEIAQAMLRRQQAEAIIAARRQIVDGAVGMVQMALHDLEENGVVKLDEERKAAMVNNLLVALVSESEAQPVINTGSLYT